MNTNIDENLRREKENLRHEKMQAEIAKIFAEIEKMRTDNQKTIKETVLYPLVVGASLILAGGSAAIGAVAVVKLFL